MHSRFEQQSFTVVKDIEECVLSGKVSEVMKSYPELEKQPRQVKLLFCEVEKLLRLLLVLPVSSCEAEHSFSALC